MLVLSRKPGEELVVPDIDLVVRIVEVRGDKVRIGISAPAAVRVYRREVWDKIENAAVAPTLTAVSNPEPDVK